MLHECLESALLVVHVATAQHVVAKYRWLVWDPPSTWLNAGDGSFAMSVFEQAGTRVAVPAALTAIRAPPPLLPWNVGTAGLPHLAPPPLASTNPFGDVPDGGAAGGNPTWAGYLYAGPSIHAGTGEYRATLWPQAGWTALEASVGALRERELPWIRAQLRLMASQMAMMIVLPQLATALAPGLAWLARRQRESASKTARAVLLGALSHRLARARVRVVRRVGEVRKGQRRAERMEVWFARARGLPQPRQRARLRLAPRCCRAVAAVAAAHRWRDHITHPYRGQDRPAV